MFPVKQIQCGNEEWLYMGVLKSNRGYINFKKGGKLILIFMKIPKTGSSLRQVAYARRAWGANQETKKLIALDVGYSPSVANSVVSKIESRPGFNNAMAKLAAESNNLALTIMHEFKSRGVKSFSNKDLVSSLNAIAGAWDRFNKGLIESNKPVDNGKNRLRTVILQNINGNVTNTSEEQVPDLIEPQPEDSPTDLDF